MVQRFLQSEGGKNYRSIEQEMIVSQVMDHIKKEITVEKKQIELGDLEEMVQNK